MFCSFSFRLGPYAICFATGIAFYHQFQTEHVEYALGLATLVCMLGLKRWSLTQSSIWRVLALSLMFFLGVWRGKSDAVTPIEFKTEWRGMLELTQPFTSSRFGFAAKGQTEDGEMFMVYSSSADTTLGPGSWIYCSGSILPFAHSSYPFSFDPRQYYSNLRIVGKLTLDQMYVHIEKSLDVRSSFSGRINSWPLHNRAKAFYQAMLTGDKSEIAEEDRIQFANSGLVHVLAVSGLHVGMMVYLLSLLTRWNFFKKNRAGQWIRAIVVLSGLWGFVFLAGAGSSSLRSGIMFSLVYLAGLSKVKGNSREAIWYAGFLILLFDPFQLFQVGFQLSFAAVIGILYGHSIFQQSILKLANGCSKKWKRRVVVYILSGLSVSFWAQLTTLPFVLHYFHSFPNYFLLTNAIFLPAIPLFLLSGLLLAVLFEFGISEGVIWRALDLSVEYYFDAVHWVGSLPHAVSHNIYLSLLSIIAMVAAITVFIIAIHFRKWHFYGVAFALLIGMLLIEESETRDILYQHITEEGSYIELIEGGRSLIYGNDVEGNLKFLRNTEHWRNSLGVDTLLFRPDIDLNLSSSKVLSDWHKWTSTLPVQ